LHISNNRFCIFLNNQNTADEIIKNHNKINTNNNEITLKKLINPSKRIIFSNVYSIIPDQSIIKVFQELGIRTTSELFSLKSIASSDFFAHVTSFRKQIFINPDDISKIPDSISIKQKDTTFRIFVTDDTLTCFKCKQSGHLSSTCKYSMDINSQSNITTQTIPTLNQLNPIQNTKIPKDKNFNLPENKKPKTYKRLVSVSTSPSSP
jgi:hypothetical protein